MLFQGVDLTTALRPILLPDETLLFVQNGVGLYEGKFKVSEYQDGQLYLTSHRVYYVDNDEPRKRSVALYLKAIERPEFYAGFLKSSPKVTLYLRLTKGTPALNHDTGSHGAEFVSSSASRRYGGPLRTISAPSVGNGFDSTSWICPICTLPNKVPPGFDPTAVNSNTPMPPCATCGIKPPCVVVVKAAIAGIAKRPAAVFGPTDSTSPSFNRLAGQTSGIVTDDEGRIVCPRCTFHNHPSVLTCEICEASLLPYKHIEGPERTDSPSLLSSAISAGEDAPDSIKFAFRSGGEKIFFERLRDALIQRKWLLQNAPPIPGPAESSSFTADDTSLRPSAAAGKRSVGIAGLERRGLELRKNNELVIGNAFADLSALMTSAKEVIALAESFKQSQLSSESSPESTALINQSASALGLVTTKDMLAPGGAPLYLSELSRHLAELLTDDATAVLRREGGIVSLVDLWALVNRARGGVELVSPQDFLRAAELWEALKLPVRLRRFRSGLLVVQGTDRTDQKTVAALLAWFATLKLQQPEGACSWDWQKYGRGVSVLDTAEKFRWSIGVAVEGLEMAEERGALCREVTLGGIRYWENWLLRDP